MRLIISNSSNQPIYEQVVDQLKTLILKNDLMQGDALPSIRKLSKELQISVITTKRAYEILEREGFIETVRGKGSFVATQNKELIKERKMKIIEEKIQEAVDEAKMLGITLDELSEMMTFLYEEI